MALLRPRQQLAARAIIMGAALCLFVLQALAVKPAFGANAGDGVSHSLSLSKVVSPCEAHGGGATPAQGRHDHSQCCIFCCANGREAASVVTGALLGVLPFPALESSGLTVGFSIVDPYKRLIGWTSSWSSRAPPHI